ncbi:hypothetical protein AKJ16_DCAP15663 [Drosera capensis]
MNGGGKSLLPYAAFSSQAVNGRGSSVVVAAAAGRGSGCDNCHSGSQGADSRSVALLLIRYKPGSEKLKKFDDLWPSGLKNNLKIVKFYQGYMATATNKY